MSKSAVAGCTAMFGLSFLLVAVVYQALPPELPLTRFPSMTVAPKSAFTAFRVPLMNLSHGLMAVIMLSRTGDFSDARRRASYAALFSTLLFAIALKSDFEALEISSLVVSLQSFRGWAAMGTVIAVAGGLVLAFVRGRGVPLPWSECRLPLRHQLALLGLLAAYLAIVAMSLLISHRR